MTDAAGLAIRTEDLRKTYKSSRGDVPAVRGIDLSVGSGQFFGLLGPNGAGKSTTIGMLTTLVLPTGGQAWVAGMDVVANPVGVKRRIGVVTQNNTLDMQLTVAENLEFRSRFFGLSLREAQRRAEQLLEVFGLADRRKAMSTDLSGGQAKRLLIARALVHRPDVLFLDEPTAGLDPQTRANLWDILRVLHAEGQTILLTTHYMEEAEALCEQVSVVDHGEVLASGTVNELKAGTGAETVITVRYDEPVPDGMAEHAGLGRRAGVSKVEADGDQVRVFTREPDGVLGELVTAGSAAGLSVLDATQLKPSGRARRRGSTCRTGPRSGQARSRSAAAGPRPPRSAWPGSGLRAPGMTVVTPGCCVTQRSAAWAVVTRRAGSAVNAPDPAAASTPVSKRTPENVSPTSNASPCRL